MAVLKCTMLSEYIGRTVDYTAIIPTMQFSDMMEGDFDYSSINNLKTLYLLHGIGDSGEGWINGTRIALWAQEKRLAVIMINGDNSFYTDLQNGMKYSKFAGKEIVDATRALFSLSNKREDTFIAGLSMGGYGAIKTGLRYNDTFGYMASMSGAMDICAVALNSYEGKPFGSKRYFKEIFGDLDKLEGSEHDLYSLLESKLEKGADIPKMYQACGSEDFLIEANRAYRDFAKSKDIDITYEEGSGGHTYEFWDEYLLKIVNWLPL